MIRSLLLATAALTISGPALAASGAPIMPAPASDTPREGAFVLDARTVIAPAQLPVGVLTALIGVPVFLFLLARQPR